MIWSPVCVIQSSSGRTGVLYVNDNVKPWLTLYGGTQSLAEAHKPISKVGGERK